MKSCGFRFDTTYTKLPEYFYTMCDPVAVSSPSVVVINDDLAKSMGLDFVDFSNKELAELFSGNQLPKGSTPFAQGYAGHQFGHFTMLGDGRAIVLGEHITPGKERLDIQFKGSGRTPYSRNGDGRAALGPMLREYIISEAMHYLGIPTTRSLAVVTTGEPVIRDTVLPGAILTRVASSHIRVGTFEFVSYNGNKKDLSLLTNHVIQRHYPHLKDSKNKALDLLKAVVEKQADLIVNWMRVGFIHGVMNTDNMLLSGETIDYGPCAFMDFYNPDTVFSSIDHAGRYAYDNQPVIAKWNLGRLADTLLSLIHDDTNKAIDMASNVIDGFQDIFRRKWLVMMRTKLGLFGTEKGDMQLISDLLKWMQNNNADYTNTFYSLTYKGALGESTYRQKDFKAWYQRWQDRINNSCESLESSRSLMKNNNPVVIPRNHIVENVLDAANEGNLKPFGDLLGVIKKPYQDNILLKSYKAPPKPNQRIYQTFCGT